MLATNYLGAVWCPRAFLPGLEAAAPATSSTSSRSPARWRSPRQARTPRRSTRSSRSRARLPALLAARGDPRAHRAARLRRDGGVPAADGAPSRFFRRAGHRAGAASPTASSARSSTGAREVFVPRLVPHLRHRTGPRAGPLSALSSRSRLPPDALRADGGSTSRSRRDTGRPAQAPQRSRPSPATAREVEVRVEPTDVRMTRDRMRTRPFASKSARRSPSESSRVWDGSRARSKRSSSFAASGRTAPAGRSPARVPRLASARVSSASTCSGGQRSEALLLAHEVDRADGRRELRGRLLPRLDVAVPAFRYARPCSSSSERGRRRRPRAHVERARRERRRCPCRRRALARRHASGTGTP